MVFDSSKSKKILLQTIENVLFIDFVIPSFLGVVRY